MKEIKTKTVTHLLETSFTIIELLVVVSVIAILFSLLLPALKTAKEYGRITQCLANLKQMGIITFNYAEEQNGYIYPAVYNNNMWSQILLISGAFDGVPVYPKYDSIPAYCRPKIMACPTRYQTLPGFAIHENMKLHYGVNLYLAGYKNATLGYSNIPKLSGISMPSNRFVLTETNGYSYTYATTYGSNLFLDYRHNGGINLLFVDGHVAFRKQMLPVYNSAATPKRPYPW